MDRGVRGGFALLVLVALLALSGVAAGEANEPPLAEAGLDQQVRAGETVRLDATGSRDPDGNVTGYEWSIETPSGGTTTPDCGTCGTTSFRPETPGQYNVTVTVTDDDGARRTDTLYVEVDPAPGPSVSLSGPSDPTIERSRYGDPSGSARYVANFSRGGNPIDYVEWVVDGEQTVQRPVNDSSVDSINYVHSMESAATHTLTVRIVDTAGRDATDSMTVSPQVQTANGGSGGGDDGYDGVMQAEWGGRTITFEAPTIDTSTGEVVQQSGPNLEQLNAVATADPGEEVQTKFDDEDGNSGNQNQDSVNDKSDNTINNIVNDVFSGIGIPNTSSDSGGSSSEKSSSDNSGFGGICPIC
ncbi:PKD domain-containing protein [Halorientalis regularis]|uniref:PKD domain-containing protein n=1 Tax=Halorientalis regularis TaxID=660518 RepID=A0A1G7HIF7_9EURY|nr:PKD domain-containing protein [Halorientalis regularis]SDF00270.1 PKD domain-containing protein [Halorientalis regularis]